MPGDPLGSRLGGESISGGVETGARVTVLARKGVEPGPGVDEQGRARRFETGVVLGVIALLALGALWFYWRRGHVNFAGQGHNQG